MGSGGTDYPLGDTEMRSVQGGGIHTGGGLPVLMRFRRILRICAKSVMTAITFMGL